MQGECGGGWTRVYRGCVPGLSTRDYHNIVHGLCEVKSLGRVRLFETPWIVAYQAPPSMGFSSQEYWNGLLFPSPGGSS